MKKEFQIHTEIYKKDIIKSAIEAFQDMADITFENQKLIISGEDTESINEIFHEFMNYTIGLIHD